MEITPELSLSDELNTLTIIPFSYSDCLITLNEMLSPEIQASRYDSMKVLPVLDNTKLSDEQKAAFDAVDLGKGTIPQDELLAKRLPEMPAELVPIIEEIWAEEVVGK